MVKKKVLESFCLFSDMSVVSRDHYFQHLVLWDHTLFQSIVCGTAEQDTELLLKTYK